MKRTFFSFSLFLTIVLAMVGCNVQPQEPVAETPAPGEKITITAIQEGYPQTKTVLNSDGSVYWLPSDAIGVFFGNYNLPFYAYTLESAASALFVGQYMVLAGSGEDGSSSVSAPTYYSIFPYDLDNDEHDDDFRYEREANASKFYGAERNGDVITSFLPSMQRGVPGTFDRNLNITLAKSNDYHTFVYYNVLGGIRFKLNEPGIKKVVLKGNNDEPLAGVFNMTAGSDKIPVISSFTGAKKEISVVIDGKAQTSFQTGEWYYLMLPPTTFSKGITMEFYKDNASASMVTTTAQSVKRKTFSSLENPDRNLSWTPIVHPETLSLESSYSVVNMTVGDKRTMNVSVTPAECTFPVVWSSSDSNVVTVDQEGTITAVGEGEATVSVTCDQLTKYVNVNVYSGTVIKDFYIAFNGNKVNYLDVNVGEPVQLEAVFLPSTAAVPVQWSSNNEGYVSVDKSGRIIALRESGARITARAGEWVADVYISPSYRDGEFEIVSVDLSSAEALVNLKAPESYTATFDLEEWEWRDTPLCLNKVVGSNNTQLKFTFSSDDKDLEMRLNADAFVSGELYWWTDRYIVIHEPRVYCKWCFGPDGKRLQNGLYGDCDIVIRLADSKVFQIRDIRPEGHWLEQQNEGVWRNSYDGSFVYGSGYDYNNPSSPFCRYSFINGGVEKELLIDFSNTDEPWRKFDMYGMRIVLDKDNNLAFIENNTKTLYAIFSDGSLSKTSLPENDRLRLVENNYNWYLFDYNDVYEGVLVVFQIQLNGKQITMERICQLTVADFDLNNLIMNGEEVKFVYGGFKTVTFNIKNKSISAANLETIFPDAYQWDMKFNAIGTAGYRFNDGVLNVYDMQNLTKRTINTDRSKVPDFDGWYDEYDSVNNCFFESGQSYSDGKMITVVTDCDTGKVTVYEFKMDYFYLKLK